MKRGLTFLLIAILLSATLVEAPAHCHGNACGVEEQHAMLDGYGNDHGDEAPADTNDDDTGKNPAKSGLHGWHSHAADPAVNQTIAEPLPSVASKVSFSRQADLASLAVPPLLEPPALA